MLDGRKKKIRRVQFQANSCQSITFCQFTQEIDKLLVYINEIQKYIALRKINKGRNVIDDIREYRNVNFI